MPGPYGGELYGRSTPTPYQFMRDQEALDLQDRRYNYQLKQARLRNNAKVSATINNAFDTTHLSTGTSADPIINAKIKSLIDKYQKMYMDSKGTLDAADMSLAMQSDMMNVKAYHDSINVIKANVQKEANAVAKQYPGFSPQELYARSMDRALYRNGKVVENFEDLDLNADYVNDVIDNDYSSLHVSNKGMLDEYQKMKPTEKTLGIATRNTVGQDVWTKGTARYFPKFQDLTYDPRTGEPKIGLKTLTVKTPEGNTYKDKVTGNPVDVIDEPTFQEVTQNRQLAARINQLADQQADALQARGVFLNDADRNILRRQIATQQLDGVFGNKSLFLQSNKYPLPKDHRYKLGRVYDPTNLDLDAMRTDSVGNRDMTSQLGGWQIKDSTLPAGHQNAEIWLTPRGGLMIKAHDYDQYGRIMRARDPIEFNGEKARRFIRDSGGFSQNKKQDVLALLDLFADSQDPYNGMGLDWQNKPAPSIPYTPPTQAPVQLAPVKKPITRFKKSSSSGKFD